jgi:hypothetical protein
MAVNFETETGLSPLSLAVLSGNDKLALLLLERGALMDQDILIKLAIVNRSLPLLRFLGNSKDGDPFGAGHLCDALSFGTSDEVLEYLIKKVSGKSPYGFGSVFYVLARSGLYASPGRANAMAHRLLNAGIVPQKEDYQQGRMDQTLNILYQRTKDPALLKRFEYWDASHAKPPQADLDRDLGDAISLEEVDSLLRLGADPLGLAADYQRRAVREGLPGPLGYKIRKYCGDNDRTFSALDWRIAGRFLDHSPDRVRPLLDSLDSLFIGATTGRLAMVKTLVKSHGGEDFVVRARTCDSNQALSFAAEARDSAMTAYLLGFRFGPKPKELALKRAVLAGAPAVVDLLLDHGADFRLPSYGGSGFTKLFDILFDGRWDFPRASDTLIAKSLMAAYRNASSPSQSSTYPLPMARYAVRMVYNPVLLGFLLKQDTPPMDSDTLFDGIRGGWEGLGDSTIMARVSTEGHEDRILGSILGSYFQHTRGKFIDTPGRIIDVLARLNGFVARGVALGKGLDADWHADLGKYQVGYDRGLNRFVLIWRVPSLYSSKPEYNSGYFPGQNHYDWVGSND